MKLKRGVFRLKKDISSKAKKISKEIKKDTTTAILAAFAFIIALVWRDAIQLTVDRLLEYINLTGDAYIYKIITALVVTFICVMGIMYFSRWSEK